ncbi:hypothetical protein Dimus_004877, partial [Dionaea muscipula]
MPKYTDMGIDDDGEVFFIEPEKDSVAANPSSVPGSSTLIIGGSRSPTSAANDLLEVDNLLGASRVDAAALASREQSVKAALDATGLKDE